MEQTITCIHCKETKPTTEYHFRKDRGTYHTVCKPCWKIRSNKDYIKNAQKIAEKAAGRKDEKKAYNKEHRQKNLERLRAKDREYDRTHKEQRAEYKKKYNKANAEKIKEYHRAYRLVNREKVSGGLLATYHRRYKSDIRYNLIRKYRNRLRDFKSYIDKDHKKGKVLELLGCTPEFFKQHIENLFTEGMTWEKVFSGEIHIDHIIPLSSAKDEEDLKKLSHYTNLQPLWKLDNLSKGSKIPQ